MANQMTPDEMRETAKRLRAMVSVMERLGETADGERAGADALDRLADVLDGEWPEHWARCSPRQFTSKSSAYAAGYRAAREDAAAIARGESSKPCACYQCIQHEIRDKPFPHNTVQFMVICESCGNKRCPHAEHHDNPCTGSNEPGQPGAVRYPVSSGERPALTPEDLAAKTSEVVDRFRKRRDEITGHVTASGETDEREER